MAPDDIAARLGTVHELGAFDHTGSAEFGGGDAVLYYLAVVFPDLHVTAVV